MEEGGLVCSEDAAQDRLEDVGVLPDGEGEWRGLEGECGAPGVERGEGGVGEGRVVVDERVGEGGREARDEDVADDDGERVAEGVSCVGLALLEGVRLVAALEVVLALTFKIP